MANSTLDADETQHNSTQLSWPSFQFAAQPSG